MLESNKGVSELCDIFLFLERQPVGIKFFLNETDYTDCIFDEPQRAFSYCTTVKNAASGSRSVKLTKKHFACPAAGRALGLIERGMDSLSGKAHYDMGLYEDLGISRYVQSQMMFCKHTAYGVGVAPLTQYTEYNPDIVIIVTKPYSIMRILQGYAYKYGQLSNIQMSGIQALCHECTSYPYENNAVNISMMCSGTRCVSGWGDDEAGVGIPYNKLKLIIEGVVKTSNSMDDNKHKKVLLERLKEEGIEDITLISIGKNYYTSGYSSHGLS